MLLHYIHADWVETKVCLHSLIKCKLAHYYIITDLFAIKRAKFVPLTLKMAHMNEKIRIPVTKLTFKSIISLKLECNCLLLE